MGIYFGNESEFVSSGIASHISSDTIDLTKFVVTYQDKADSDHGTARIGTISGTNIAFHTESEFASDNATQYNCVNVLSGSKFVVSYWDSNDSGHGTSRIGTVSGTDITFGVESEFLNSGAATEICSDVISENKFVVVYRDGQADRGTAKIGTVSGTTIAFGTKSEFLSSGTANYISIAPINVSNFIVAYQDDADSGHGTARLGIDIIVASQNLFIYGHDTPDLFVGGFDFIPISGDLFVDGHINVESSGDLFVRGKDNLFCLYPDNVLFYHPTNDYTEDTQQLPWDRNIVTFDDGIVISGATITASGHTAFVYDNQTNIYPSVSGATSIAIAYWGKNFYRTGPDAELCVANSSDADSTVDKNGLHIHGNTGKPALHINGSEDVATGALSPLPNDTEWHFTVIYAEISGGNWRIYGSIDGGSLDLLGNLSADQPLGNQRYLIIEIDDTTESTPAPIVDEIICWVNLSAPFTSHEINNLYALARIFSAPMDEYSLHQTHQSSATLFISGPEQNTASGDLFINGHAVKIASAELFISGFNNSSISGDMFVNGHISTITSGDFFITGLDSNFVSGDLYICSHVNVITSGDLFIEGTSTQQLSNNIDLFIHGLDTLTTSGDFWVNGHENILSSVDTFVHGYDDYVASGDLYLNGHVVVETSGNLFTNGLILINNSVDLFVKGSGIFPYSGNIDLIINGYKPKPALVCPILDPTASIQIKDSLIRIYQSRIDALINQLGKNVYLEFDPIRDPCPNCTYDTMRKRSTGIYIPGGPRPFKRGRRCPWCKGRGFTETAVNKCIKCLIKWNPEDAKNFGISVSKNSGIVRLKTFLTEADDLMRAQTVIVNHDIVGQMKLRVKLIQGPIPVGLREDRYCISFWELI